MTLGSTFPLAALALAATLPAGAQPPRVHILEPAGDQPVFGKVEIVAEVEAGDPVSSVEFFVNGRSRGVLREPPYRLQVDVGQGNQEHRFEVRAWTATGLTATATVETPAIRIDEAIDLRLQQLYVTASRGGQRILDLGRHEFRVLEDGVEQRLVTFERGDIPFTAVLLLDCSGSMTGERMTLAFQGARTFVQGMKPLDEAMVVLFSDQLLRASPFTQDPQVLLDSLTEDVEGDGTALNDYLFFALKLLDARQGRRVVILLSDGADVHSFLSMGEVLWKARRSQALIYWIHLQGEPGHPQFTSSWRDAQVNQKEFQDLQKAVLESGGRIALLQRPEELDEAFGGILAELREQYVLGYYPANPRRDGSWRKVQIRVRRPGVTVRAREGYLDY